MEDHQTTRDTVFFLSDLHLGAAYFRRPREVEMRAVRFLDSIKDRAEAIYLVGDVLDYWYEYRYVVPRGFVRFLGKIAELADSGIQITWLIGNHDIWIYDYLPSELGIEVVDGSIIREIQGRCCYIAHGDGLGRTSRGFRFIRAMFRNRVCQRLFAGVHPRWTVPLGFGWSGKNRNTHPVPEPYRGPGEEPLIQFAAQHAGAHPEIDFYIFGHRHILIDEPLNVSSAHAIILGEWIESCSWAEMRGGQLRLHSLNGPK